MATPQISDAEQELQALLPKGLAVVETRQRYKARNRVTCVCSIDLDNDGDIEIIFGAADGRLGVLSKECEERWTRIVGDKSPVTTVAILPWNDGSRTSCYIAAGTASGYLYIFNKHGQIVNKDGTCNPFNASGTKQEDKDAYWFSCEQAINQVVTTQEKTAQIIFTSEDRHVYGLQGKNGSPLWNPFPTDGWARCIFACDLNKDHHAEILVSTANCNLYLLDHHGHTIRNIQMEHPIRALFAADIDHDGKVEILIATDKHDLIALTSDFRPLWSVNTFFSRLRALYVVDIDRNGTNEIIAGGDDKHLYILNTQGKILWRYLLGARIASLSANDVDGDGIQEIIVGADDERVHILRVNLARPEEGLYEQLLNACARLGSHSSALLSKLIHSERELLRDITCTNREEPISLAQAEEPFHRGRYKEALAMFLLLQQQKIQVLWQQKTEYDPRILCFGSHLGDLIVGTTEGLLRSYNTEGRELWSFQLAGQILSAQLGPIQNTSQEDILVCSTDHHIYLIGYPAHNKKSPQGLQPEVLNCYTIDPLISSVALKPGFKHTEIVFGSESQKIYIYHRSLNDTPEQIATSQGVRIVQFYPSKYRHKDAPDIIAARTDHFVVAYKYGDPAERWSFKAWNRVRALSVRDIDGDSHDEIIIGSDDRNVHVLNDKGQLKWRYYLPYSVLCTYVADINQDGYLEVLAGCADGYLYVFDKEGNLLWQYQTHERITAITSREHDNSIEIALGTENRVELLQVLDSDYLQNHIDHCWQKLIQGQSEKNVVQALLNDSEESVLHAFALQRIPDLFQQDEEQKALFARFHQDLKNSSVEIRKALVHTLLACYSFNPTLTRPYLDKLSTDREREVKLELVEHMHRLMQDDCSVGFEYLTCFSDNIDRYVHRAVIRKLYSLIDERKEDQRKQIFQLLLEGALNPKYAWVRQEAGRALAHYLDNYPLELLLAIHHFIARGVAPDISLHMAHHAAAPLVRETLDAFYLLQQDDLGPQNVVDRLKLAARALHRIQDSRFGKDTCLLYEELLHLFNLETLQDIAQYHYRLTAHQPEAENRYFIAAKRVFESIPGVTRILKIYFHRQHDSDQISSLQEASRAIDRLYHFMGEEYRTIILGERPTKLPDYRFFELLFRRWQELVQLALKDLLGAPEIITRLLTRQTYYERHVSIVLEILNGGRSPAYSVRVALLHNEDFMAVLPAVAQSEVLFWQETQQAEFTIKLNRYKERIDLNFEITYDDGEKQFCKANISECLMLQPMPANDYEFIPNPYSTGTPVQDKSMFFGRERDVELLKRELSLNTAQRIIVLHGLRRSGKTSLLRHLVDNNVLDHCIPVYIDMQNIIHSITENRLFYKIAFVIQQTIVRKKQFKLAPPALELFMQEPTFAFDRFLDEVAAHLLEERLVLLIDEFEILQEQTDQGQLQPTIFAYLRSLMQRNINFLLAGTHKLEQLTKDYWSTFYNFALPLRLSKISEQGAIELITYPVKPHLTYDTFAIDKIRQLTGDQPFLLHCICRILVDHCNELRKTYVSLHDVHALIDQAIMLNNNQFNGFWCLLSLQEHLVLAAIAQGGRERSLSLKELEEVYRVERIPCDQQQLHEALRSLIQKDLLESVLDENKQENLRYRIPIGMLRIWVSQERPLSAFKQHTQNTHR